MFSQNRKQILTGTANRALLNSDERKILLHRSVHGIKLDEEEILKAVREKAEIESRLRDERFMRSRIDTCSGTRFPPVEGCVLGAQWNRYVKDIWTNTRGIILHTVQLPPGKTSQDMTFYTAKVVKRTERTLSPGVLPETVTKPCAAFEAYLEHDTIPRNTKLPAHFVVTDAKAPPLCTFNKLNEEYERMMQAKSDLAQAEIESRRIAV